MVDCRLNSLVGVVRSVCSLLDRIFSKLFVEVKIKPDTFSKGIDGCHLIAVRDLYFFSVETSDIGPQVFVMPLRDCIEVVRLFLKLSTACKLLHECNCEMRKRSSGSVVPSYCFMFGKLNFLGISTITMSSTKGESAKLFAVLFLNGAGTAGILCISASISANLRENSLLIDAVGLQLDPVRFRFGLPGAVRSTSYSSLGTGIGRPVVSLSGITPSRIAYNSTLVDLIATFSVSSASNFTAFVVICVVRAAICSSTVAPFPLSDILTDMYKGPKLLSTSTRSWDDCSRDFKRDSLTCDPLLETED
ncbi:hypothetical protein QYF36_025350 [Acer negundo]|nr:hypothetical protein QYF36_025350 [Acer negundo]